MFIRVTLIADPPLTQKKTYGKQSKYYLSPHIATTPVHTHGYLYVVVLVVRISVYVHPLKLAAMCEL